LRFTARHALGRDVQVRARGGAKAGRHAAGAEGDRERRDGRLAAARCSERGGRARARYAAGERQEFRGAAPNWWSQEVSHHRGGTNAIGKGAVFLSLERTAVLWGGSAGAAGRRAFFFDRVGLTELTRCWRFGGGAPRQKPRMAAPEGAATQIHDLRGDEAAMRALSALDPPAFGRRI